MKRTPTKPARAHHRLMLGLVGNTYDKKGLKPTPDQLDRVATVFGLAGGSWERLFKGSTDDMNLLKKAIKVAVDRELFAKSPDWE